MGKLVRNVMRGDHQYVTNARTRTCSKASDRPTLVLRPKFGGTSVYCATTSCLTLPVSLFT
eukprot:1873128-Pleurochrysis_carterae.AAC.1